MDYAEVEFMLSELNNWDQTHYVAGVTASIEYWRDLSVKFEARDATWVSDFNTAKDAYLAVLPVANKETVLTQKYLDFFDQGYQAWAEYRRTGEPKMLIKPNEISSVSVDNNMIPFIPLVNVTDIPRRMTYPQQEFTVNGANATAAAAAVGGGAGDYMTTALFWSLPQGK